MKLNPKKTVKKGFKPVTKTLPVIFTGLDQKGNKYDVDSCKKIISELQDSGCFDKLSVTVNFARNRIIEGAKGMINLARLTKYDKGSESADLLLLGKNTEYAEMLECEEDYVVVPRVLVARTKNEDEIPTVVSILSFEVVLAMEA